MGVTRTNDIPGLPGNNNFKVMYNGATRVGYKTVHTGRMAINSRPRDDRSSCWQLGFCFQGCKSGAKWSTLYTEIPKAEATGKLDLRPECQALQIQHDRQGKATGVLYADKNGKQVVQKARDRMRRLQFDRKRAPAAQLVVIRPFRRAWPIPRARSARTTCGIRPARFTRTFKKPVYMNRGTVMAGIVADEAELNTKRGFAGGFEFETISLGLPFAAAFLKPGAWGRDYTRVLDQYPNMAGMWIVGEDMPQETNAVTLHPTEKDQWGLPIPNVHYDDHPNDLAMRNYAYKRGAAIYNAVGAVQTIAVPPYPVHAQPRNLPHERESSRRRLQQVGADPRSQEPVHFRR